MIWLQNSVYRAEAVCRPLKGADLQAFLRDVNNGWQVIN